MTSLRTKITGSWHLVRDYMTALSGAAGRMVISLFYFVALANSLSVADFGLFATASATGIVLSRIVGFGFTSPLYRIATVKPRLIGVYAAGYLLFSAISLPFFVLAAYFCYRVFFGQTLSLLTFALIVMTEALLWRTLEVILIANNGMNRFGRASTLVMIGSALRALAAVGFAFTVARDIDHWAQYYLVANALGLLVGILFFMPKAKLRLVLPVYRRHITDSLSVAGAEILFYIQSELDKLLVLALGGAETAGVYAIIMRLVDLTAIPIRTFNMMLVQRLMRNGSLLSSLKQKVSMEVALFAISTIGFCGLAIFLKIFPNALGHNVAGATNLLFLVFLVPGFRNLVEYQAELLYASRQTVLRVLNLAMLAGVKAVLLAYIFLNAFDQATWLRDLNIAYGLIWLASGLLTYSAIRRKALRDELPELP